ncbi:MAG: hypothetical protein F6K30_18875 [Cyanothece sp. SIO2G6]|nr:hypothetical protein [Cyanothece sp. SIO2G6]
MTNPTVDHRILSSSLEPEIPKISLFEVLADSDSKQVKGGYWSHYSHPASRRWVTSHSHSRNRAAITFNTDTFNTDTFNTDTFNTDAIASHVPLIRSDFSHHTAANHLDDLLLT